MAEKKEPKPRRKSFTEELEEAILDADFPVMKADGTIVDPNENSTEEPK